MNDLPRHLFEKNAFPRSARYDAAWMLANQMGPNAVWLAEWLTEAFLLEPGMRVLDLGCGRALSSIFLAKEFDVRVWAADWWIGPDRNWERVCEAGVADRVTPMRVEAHALPFAKGFFDAVVSIDAYQYFGTDMLYLSYLANFVRNGGRIGVVLPGLVRPLGDSVPAHLTEPQSNGKVFWEPDLCSFRTADWWRAHWQKCSGVNDIQADTQDDGWRHWRDFEEAMEKTGTNIFPVDVEALDRDAGRTIGFVRVTATRNETELINVYDPAIGLKVGVDG